MSVLILVWTTLRNTGDSTRPLRVTVNQVRCATGCCPVDVWARPRTSDRLVLQQLFVDDEYAPIFAARWPPFRYILDAGVSHMPSRGGEPAIMLHCYFLQTSTFEHALCIVLARG